VPAGFHASSPAIASLLRAAWPSRSSRRSKQPQDLVAGQYASSRRPGPGAGRLRSAAWRRCGQATRARPRAMSGSAARPLSPRAALPRSPRARRR
jgi:hypothetical protein